MAMKSWIGGDGDWQVASNWSDGLVPAADDTVTLPSAASAYVVTLSGSTPKLAALNLGNYGGDQNPVTLLLDHAQLSLSGQVGIAQYATIEGSGAISADSGISIIWTGGGSASILAGTATTGGTLEITGAIDSNIMLGFANDLIATTLKLDSANSLSSIAVSAASQTLEIAADTSFYVAETVSGGAIRLDGATLTASSGIALTNGATLTGTGTLDGAISGSGSVIAAAGGALTLTAAVGNDPSGATSLVIGSGSSLLLTSGYGIGDDSAGVGPTLSFQGDGDLFQAADMSIYHIYLGTIDGFSGTDLIKLGSFGSGDTLSYDASAHTITISDAGGFNSRSFAFSASTDVSQIALNQGALNGATVDILSICFMPGVMIRTPDGEAAVETLRIGDLVVTAEGATAPIRWIGRQTILTRFADPVRNLPIRIRAGALGEDLPARDLRVSPDHALRIEGVLVHAGALVNEMTILRDSGVPDKFVYHHIELDGHALLLAENIAAESFVDNADRRAFDNWVEHKALYPQGRATAELDLPRVKSARQLPESIRRLIAVRARILAQAKAA